ALDETAFFLSAAARRPYHQSVAPALLPQDTVPPTFREDAMKSRRPLPLLCAALFALGSLPARGPAQPPPKPNPQAPVLNAPAPYGMQRGTSLEITLTGNNLADPTGLLASFPAKFTIPTDNKNGLDNAKLR